MNQQEPSYQNRFWPPNHSGYSSQNLDEFVSDCVLKLAPKKIVDQHRDAVRDQVRLPTTPTSTLQVRYEPTCFEFGDIGHRHIYSFSSETIQFGIGEIALAQSNNIYCFPRYPGADVENTAYQFRDELLCLFMVVQGKKHVNSLQLPVGKPAHDAIIDHLVYASQPLVASGWRIGLADTMHTPKKKNPWFKQEPIYPSSMKPIRFFDKYHYGRCGFFPLDTRNKRSRRLYQLAKRDLQILKEHQDSTQSAAKSPGLQSLSVARTSGD